MHGNGLFVRVLVRMFITVIKKTQQTHFQSFTQKYFFGADRNSLLYIRLIRLILYNQKSQKWCAPTKTNWLRMPSGEIMWLNAAKNTHTHTQSFNLFDPILKSCEYAVCVCVNVLNQNWNYHCSTICFFFLVCSFFSTFPL